MHTAILSLYRFCGPLLPNNCLCDVVSDICITIPYLWQGLVIDMANPLTVLVFNLVTGGAVSNGMVTVKTDTLFGKTCTRCFPVG